MAAVAPSSLWSVVSDGGCIIMRGSSVLAKKSSSCDTLYRATADGRDESTCSTRMENGFTNPSKTVSSMALISMEGSGWDNPDRSSAVLSSVCGWSVVSSVVSLIWKKDDTSWISDAALWWIHANMSPTYLTGSYACISMGLPGPPLLSAVWNRWMSTCRRTLAMSRAQWLKYTGRSRKILSALRRTTLSWAWSTGCAWLAVARRPSGDSSRWLSMSGMLRRGLASWPAVSSCRPLMAPMRRYFCCTHTKSRS
mmetsp:Transcript_3290/g.8304  ORF Transcript_3290/g.8304 Transcript_3290/m.8304 type:complete len:253 (-) Transcript_3290:590-1348(-)